MKGSARLALRPIALCTRASLVSREVSFSLSSAAVELLFSRSQVLSEGKTEHGTYFGSTMVTFDLLRIRDRVTDEAAPAVAERVSALCTSDDRIRDRAKKLALAEAEKLAGQTLEGAQIDIAMRADGTHIHLDLDVSARLSAAGAVADSATTYPEKTRRAQ